MTKPVARLHPLDGDEIYADRLFSEFILHAIPFDCEEKALFFRTSKCLDGTPMTLAGAIFYLKKDGDAV